MTAGDGNLGLEGEFNESDLPLLVRRAGMAVWDDGVVRILDRRALPSSEKYLECRTVDEVAVAIETMVHFPYRSQQVMDWHWQAIMGRTARRRFMTPHSDCSELVQRVWHCSA